MQARIDATVEKQAATVLAAMGLTVSDAVRLMLTRVARAKALPFKGLAPDATTIAAMKEPRREKKRMRRRTSGIAITHLPVPRKIIVIATSSRIPC